LSLPFLPCFPATQELCDLTLKYLPPQQLGLERDDVPRSRWPPPRRQLPPFHDGFTDYLRAVAPGVYVGCDAGACLSHSRLSTVQAGESMSLSACTHGSRGALHLQGLPLAETTAPSPLLLPPLLQAGLPYRLHRAQ
jgi:hypothetical protein